MSLLGLNYEKLQALVQALVVIGLKRYVPVYLACM